MALQTGKTRLQGRVGNVIYYKMNGRYYARSVSSLSGRRVKRDPKFARTMEFARMFGIASKLASELHRSLPQHRRNYKLYRKMTGRANMLLKVGMEAKAVAEELRKIFLPKEPSLPTKNAGAGSTAAITVKQPVRPSARAGIQLQIKPVASVPGKYLFPAVGRLRIFMQQVAKDQYAVKQKVRINMAADPGPGPGLLMISCNRKHLPI